MLPLLQSHRPQLSHATSYPWAPHYQQQLRSNTSPRNQIEAMPPHAPRHGYDPALRHPVFYTPGQWHRLPSAFVQLGMTAKNEGHHPVAQGYICTDATRKKGPKL